MIEKKYHNYNIDSVLFIGDYYKTYYKNIKKINLCFSFIV